MLGAYRNTYLWVHFLHHTLPHILFGHFCMRFKNNPGSNYLAVVRIWDRNSGCFSDMMVCRDGVLDLDREKVLDKNELVT